MSEETKKCSKCGEVKTISEFSKAGYGIGKFRAWCKQCVCVSSAAWHKNNLERIHEKKKIYSDAHKHIATKKEKERVKNLDASYVKKLLIRSFGSNVDITNEIIRLKREHIQVKRISKEFKKTVKECCK